LRIFAIATLQALTPLSSRQQMKIYADFNGVEEFDALIRLDLSSYGTLASLSFSRIRLQVGQRLFKDCYLQTQIVQQRLAQSFLTNRKFPKTVAEGLPNFLEKRYMTTHTGSLISVFIHASSVELI
jgi:hypothetical protein